MRSLSIARLGAIYIASALTAGVVLLGTATVLLDDALLVGKIWNTFEATRSEKARSLAAIRREMGYGGMIHHFKNFVLRGGDERRLLIEQRIGGAQTEINRFRTLGTTPAEEAALKAIETALRRYRAGLRIAGEMVAENKASIVIDRTVAVNDRPALEALETLNQTVNVEALKKKGSKKPVLLYELQAHLGYGGMIHNFKNFILRRDAQRMGSVSRSIALTRKQLSAYRELPLAPEEVQAIEAIAKVVDAYEKNLEVALNEIKIAALPRSIDGKVKTDDQPALNGLAILTRALVAENQIAARNLAAAVGNIVSLVTNQLWAVAVIVSIMISLTIWILHFRIVRPLNGLTDTMRTLADGDLSISIPETTQKTEIGRMAEAMTVFKTSEEERRRAADEIEERERWFRALLESAPDATIIVDANGRIQLINKQTAALFGFGTEELVGRKVEVLIPEAARAGHIALRSGYTNDALTRPMGKGMELFGQHKSGSVFPVEVSLSPIQTAKGINIAAAVRDISERKMAEEALRDAYDVISGSIDYAARIQHSVLPPAENFDAVFKDHFIWWEPRDKVGGDMYWCRVWGDGMLVILADCTGHGVPGAFVTLLATGALDRAQDDVKEGDTAALIQRMHQLLRLSLGQQNKTGETDDGLELGACYINGELNSMDFVGARFSLFKIGGEGVDEIKGDKKGIGYRHIDPMVTFSTQTTAIKEGDTFYLTSDGIIDQIGGTKRCGFGKKRLKALLIENSKLPLADQKTEIMKTFIRYQGNERRRDDVSMIGFRL